jgi:hypothetical protein
MDAKVEDWVVTPRRGKAVEINALLYNVLCPLAGWLREAQDDEAAARLAAWAKRASVRKRCMLYSASLGMRQPCPILVIHTANGCPFYASTILRVGNVRLWTLFSVGCT